jgi:hypothetical protein
MLRNGFLHVLRYDGGTYDLTFGPGGPDYTGDAMKSRQFHNLESLSEFLTNKMGLAINARRDLLDQGDLPFCLSDEQRSQWCL